MKPQMKIFILFLFLVSVLLAAQSTPWDTDSVLQNRYAEIASLVAVTLLAATGILVIVWAFANILSNEELKAYVKSELFEIVYSAFLFIILFSMFPIFSEVAESAAASIYPPNVRLEIAALSSQPETGYNLLPSHFRYPKYFLSKLFLESVSLGEDIFDSYAWTGVLGEVYISLDLFWEQRGFINYNPIKGFYHLGNVAKLQLFSLNSKVGIIAKFQEIFLHVFISGFFVPFLAAGTVLRSFQLTRKLGGLMMAISLALYFIFPLTYIFAGAVFEHSGGSIGSFKIDSTTAESLINPLGDAITEEDLSQFSDLEKLVKTPGTSEKDLQNYFEANAKDDDTICNLVFGADKGDDSDLEKTSESIEKWAGNFQENGMDVGFIDDAYIDKVAKLIFFSMSFSFFAIMATVASIRSISAVLGGDLEIAGLTHLI
ncbi:MAG: hypothetical protein PHU63_01505 [Candidatus ainarchaeum sp.]|nr:hypothetical protein [Candidatus ainarchaeum sp.]